MALLSRMNDEAEQDYAMEDARFRAMIVAMHPSEAKAILDALDGAKEESEFAPPMSEEDMEEYQPFSAEEVAATIDLLQRHGVAVS